VCFNATINLKLEPKLSGLSRVARSALSGLLALLLLASGTVAVSRALHQMLHNDAAGGHHLCLVCSFAKGQVSAADVTLLAALVVLCPLFSLRAAIPSPLPVFDYRLSPSRAPPTLTSLLSVVA
jgi:hypothetical protein